MAKFEWRISKKGAIIILCIISIMFAFFTWVMFVTYNKDLYLQSIKERGEKVTAEIVRTGYESGVTIGNSFVVLVYEYIDENGVEYVGICESRFNDLEEAEKHIGEKVEIYIDGRGESFPIDRKINPNSNIVLAVVFIVLCCASIMGIVILSRKVIKESKLKKQ